MLVENTKLFMPTLLTQDQTNPSTKNFALPLSSLKNNAVYARTQIKCDCLCMRVICEGCSVLFCRCWKSHFSRCVPKFEKIYFFFMTDCFSLSFRLVWMYFLTHQNQLTFSISFDILVNWNKNKYTNVFLSRNCEKVLNAPDRRMKWNIKFREEDMALQL